MLQPVASLRVQPLDSEASELRHNRRAYLTPDTLRTLGLVTGEWVSLTSRSDGATSLVAAQLWPRVGLDDDGTLTIQ